MQCAEFEDRLNRLLDHRLTPEEDEPLTAHARECDECSDLLYAQQRLFAGLKPGAAQPSMDLAERVVALQHSHVSRRRSAWRNAGWAVLLASAASFGGLAFMALSGGDSQPKLARNKPDGRQHSSTGLAISGVGVSQKQAPQLPRRDDKLPDDTLEEYFVVLESIANQISDSREFDEMSESLEPGIKPIRSSFGLAFDALRRTLPRGKDNRPARPDSGANWLLELPAIS